jgi:hypothetical protein
LKEKRREVRTRQTVREEQRYDLPVAPSAASPAVPHNVLIYYMNFYVQEARVQV